MYSHTNAFYRLGSVTVGDEEDSEEEAGNSWKSPPGFSETISFDKYRQESSHDIIVVG